MVRNMPSWRGDPVCQIDEKVTKLMDGTKTADKVDQHHNHSN